MIPRIGDRDDEFRILTDVARLRIARGDLDGARDRATAARDIGRSLRHHEGTDRAEAELLRATIA